MKMIPALLLLLFVAVLSVTLSNQELAIKYIDSLHVAAGVSEAVSPTAQNKNISVEKSNKPTFMKVEKINQHELPAQARIGYLLSRGL